MPGGAVHPDFSLMKEGDMFDDTESQAGSSDGAATGFIHAVKAFKNPGAVCGRDAGALIDDLNADFVGAGEDL